MLIAMAFENVKQCLLNRFSRHITGEVIPTLDLKDGAIVSHIKGHYKAFTSQASGDNVVIVLSQLSDGTLTYEGEFEQQAGKWIPYYKSTERGFQNEQ